MKKYLLFVGYLFSVIALFYLIDFCAGAMFDKFLFLENNPQLKRAYYGGGGEEIAIIGASRAAHHYIPSIITKETGLKCYNYGMDGRNIFNHFVVEQELLSQSSPKLIILEVAYIDIEDSPGWNGEKLSNLYVLYKYDKNVKTIIDKVNHEEGIALSLSNLYRYNSSVLSLLVKKYHPSDDSSLQGYIPLYAEWSGNDDIIDNTVTSNIYPLKKEYLQKFIQSCQDAGVKLIVYNSPDFRIIKNPTKWENQIKRICDEYNVPFINHAVDSLFRSHKDWFNEPFHLNDKGAQIYSSIVAKEIDQLLTKKQ